MKILVPVDGSSFTKRMLAYLAAHDEWLGDHQEYVLLHVAPAVPPSAAAVLDRAVLKAHYAEESDKVFKPIRAFFAKQKIKAEFVAKAGVAAELEARVWPLLAGRRLAPVMDMIFPLREAWRAHERMEEGDHIGKIVLDVA